MTTYRTDDEQAEALKQWWRENGRSIIVGGVLGLVLVLGWQGWQKVSREQAQQSSASYETFRAQVAAEAPPAEAAATAAGLSSGTYRAFAELELARVAQHAGDAEAAAAHLRTAMAEAGDPQLEALAALRLARVLLTLDQLDAAAGLLDTRVTEAYAGERAAVRGDLAQRRGDATAATAAYQEALRLGAGDAELIRMKLADLTPATQAGS